MKVWVWDSGRCFVVAANRRLWAGMACAARGRRGVAAAEYALMAVAIVIVVGAATLQLADPTTGAYTQMRTVFTSALGSILETFRPGQ